MIFRTFSCLISEVINEICYNEKNNLDRLKLLPALEITRIYSTTFDSVFIIG
jgi:hypothetical protein